MSSQQVSKKCYYCNILKNTNDFYKASHHKDGLASYCKNCFNKKCMKRWVQRKIKCVQFVGSECTDCKLTLKNSHYSVFDFHHLDKNKKDFDWSKMRLQSWNIIYKKLTKYILLCSNCHRIRHSKEDLTFPEQQESQ